MPVSVSLKNLTISYARHPAVHHVSGIFASGSLTAITGPNGAGKSTLLKAIAGIITDYEGQITLDGKEPPVIAYLPQASELQRDFPISVLHMVTTGYWQRVGGRGPITAEMKEKACEALAQVGLAGLENRDLASLSAGQFQRALFARVLLQDASLILLDEPFNAIDGQTTSQLINIMRRWHDEGRTVICITHDIEQIRMYFPRCLLLARECVAWDFSSAVLQPEHLRNSTFFRADFNANAVCEINA